MLRLVGHKGADAIVPGNTLESFAAAVEAGVDTIELDVLWLEDAHLPLEQRAPLVIAHDWADAAGRTPLTLTEALDAFLEPPLDKVEIDLDIKLPGREEELVDALRERGLTERAMVSTMELYSLGRIVQLAPELRRGWTYPKVTKDWTSKPWAKPALPVALQMMRYRLPGLAAEKLTKIDVSAMWVY
ncbi:MAG TPA: glycerophosphodiester phosphodiesterase, partial [Solirubrobacterales bacterium]|nr:glycerophosphodiester phosphodiesterase [Solirubrobacterales bacterium]